MSIDVLVIKTLKNKEFWESTFASLRNHPIYVHEVNGEGKSQLENMLVWPDICTSEFISYVCDDDLVTESAFEKCSLHLQQNAHIKALFTNSRVIDSTTNRERTFYGRDFDWSVSNHLKVGGLIHQLIIVKRELVQYAINRLKQLHQYQEVIKDGSEKILIDIVATQVPWHYLPEICYVWRRHKDSSSHTKQSKSYKELRKQLFKDERIY